MHKTSSLNLPFAVRTFSLNWKAVLGFIWILAILTVSTLFLFYIFQVDSFATKKYLVRDYQKELNKLTIESKALELNSLQANSLNNIIASLEGLNLERVNKTYYIRVLDTKVVTK